MEDQGQRLIAGRYRLLSPLGAGGMGTVWRAQDELLGREVAVKEVTFPHGLSDADREVLHERTRREARAAAQLDHPSAVTVYDVVEQDGAPYLVMELLESRTLAEVVRTDGPMSPQRTAEIGLALLGALETAHAQGILHRDVKPSNVLLGAEGRVVLTDFGIATSTGDSSLTHTGLLMGSPAYIAPERARGEAPGPPSDLWSLGATLFTAVEGRAPYDGTEPLVTVVAVVTGEHAPFEHAGPLVPVLDGLLTKDPELRLDAAGARSRLEEVAASAAATQAPTAVAAPAPAVDAERRAARTSALSLGAVRDEIAAAEPDAPPAPPAAPPPAPPAAPTPAPQPAPQAQPAPAPLLDPAPERRRRPAWAVPAAAAALLLTMAAGGIALTADDDPDGTAAGPTATPTASPSAASPSPSSPAPAPTTAAPPPPSSAPPSPAAEGVPAGWTTDTGGSGWTVALPPGYAQTRSGEYRHGDTGRTLRIETGEGQPDAVADRERAAADFEQRHPTYEEIRIESADYRGYEAADWEFTYEGLHVINRVFVVDGTGHSLYFQTSESDFAAAQEDFAGIAEAFTPVGG